MMYAQAQTFFPLSTRVAQAGLLIAFFEYAHYLPETAFVTLGLCVRILQAEALGPAADDHNSRSFYCICGGQLSFLRGFSSVKHQ